MLEKSSHAARSRSAFREMASTQDIYAKMVIGVFSAMPMGTPGAGVDPIVGYLKRNIVGS